MATPATRLVRPRRAALAALALFSALGGGAFAATGLLAACELSSEGLSSAPDASPEAFEHMKMPFADPDGPPQHHEPHTLQPPPAMGPVTMTPVEGGTIPMIALDAGLPPPDGGAHAPDPEPAPPKSLREICMTAAVCGSCSAEGTCTIDCVTHDCAPRTTCPTGLPCVIQCDDDRCRADVSCGQATSCHVVESRGGHGPRRD